VSAGADLVDLESRVMAVLSGVVDPEIPVISVVDLGIVRGLRRGAQTCVLITPTYSGCPATAVIAAHIRQALDQAGFGSIAIETVLAPPWTTDWITELGREKLRNFGISPPQKGAASQRLSNAPVFCPHCGASDTEELSRFGSTPCKALWRCKACTEPFDHFKCH